MMARGQADEMMDLIYKSFDAYKSNFDIVLVEGTHEDPHAIGTHNPATGVLVLIFTGCQGVVPCSRPGGKHTHSSHVSWT